MQITSNDKKWRYIALSDETIKLWTPFTSDVKKGNVTIPEIIDGSIVTEVSMGCFELCHQLEQVTVPKTVKRIGAYGFTHCENLQSVYLPQSVKEVGDNAFQNDASLKFIYTDGQDIKWGKDCFKGCSITSENVLTKCYW